MRYSQKHTAQYSLIIKKKVIIPENIYLSLEV